ncbi:hypothetical protein LTS17_012597 [Exophiala oligosperma]
MSLRNISRPRASRSCDTCRAVKRRCDQQVPHCGQCIRLREQCPGYRDDWELVFRDQTGHTIRRAKEKYAKCASASRGGYSPSPVSCPGPSIDEIGVNYFLHNFLAGGQSPSRGFLNYIPTVFNAENQHPTLVASMAAVGLVALANSTRQSELASHARIKYSEAIRNVNAALVSPVESLKDSTLMSVISLGVFEHVSNFESWVRHVQGAAALVVARGKGQFSGPAQILMFNQVRADMVVVCLHQRQSFPDNMRELQEEATKNMNASCGFWSLGTLAVRCVNLYETLVNNTGGTPDSSFLEKATCIQQDFQHVPRLLTTEEPYTTTLGSEGDPQVFYNGRFDLYRSSWAIRLWNNWRMLQLCICEIMCHILKKVLATELEPVVRTHMTQKLRESLQILSKLVDDILATIPQALGLIPPESEHDCFNASSSPASVPGGYMLIWCLYLAGKSPNIRSPARKWIIRRLQAIGETADNAMARRLVQDIIRIDQLSVGHQ